MKNQDENKRRNVFINIIYFTNILALFISLACILAIPIVSVTVADCNIKRDLIDAISIINPLLAIITIFLTLILHIKDSKQNNQILDTLRKSVNINELNYESQKRALDGMTDAKISLMQGTFAIDKIMIREWFRRTDLTFNNVNAAADSRKLIRIDIFFTMDNAYEIKELHLKKFSLIRKAKGKDCLLNIVGEVNSGVTLTPATVEVRGFSIEVITDITDKFDELKSRLEKEIKPNNNSPSRVDLDIEFDFKIYSGQSGQLVSNNFRAYLDVSNKSTNVFTFIKN